MLEYQNIKKMFPKGYVPNWSKEVFVITKDKNTFPWAYVISALKDEEIAGMFYKKELQKKWSKRVQNWKSNKEKRR